jgi:hypothetical protein
METGENVIEMISDKDSSIIEKVHSEDSNSEKGSNLDLLI